MGLILLLLLLLLVEDVRKGKRWRKISNFAIIIIVLGYFVLFILCLWLLLLGGGGSENYNYHDKEPRFSSPIRNVTAPVGRDAVLSCYVEHLADYKVGWMRASDHAVLALQGKVVTQNSRYSVIHGESGVWSLKIQNVRETDRGCYYCQINTQPLKKQSGCIDVHLPPDISDKDSSTDLTIHEFQDARLFCSATGHPTPKILFRRDDGTPIIFRNNNSDLYSTEIYSGKLLNFLKVQRDQMGAYLCIAANGIEPAVSKRMILNVQCKIISYLCK